MRLLLDSHALLWSLENSPKLSARARDVIQSPAHLAYVSFASLWEITIKVALGKLEVATPWEETLASLSGARPDLVLPFRGAHLGKLLELPQFHGDPIDRMLIAQALSEDLTVVGNDPAFDAYGVRRLW